MHTCIFDFVVQANVSLPCIFPLPHCCRPADVSWALHRCPGGNVAAGSTVYIPVLGGGQVRLLPAAGLLPQQLRGGVPFFASFL